MSINAIAPKVPPGRNSLGAAPWLLVCWMLLLPRAAIAQSVFVDEFSRPDGPVGNGWSSTAGDIGAPLEIRSGALTAAVTGSTAGVYRAVDQSGAVTVSGTTSQMNGFGGLPYRYVAEFLVGSDGTLASGYGVRIYRGDVNYPSEVQLMLNGAVVAQQASSLQFGPFVDFTITYGTDGSVSGSVSAAGSSSSFSFAPRGGTPSGANFAMSLEAGGGPVYPTIDNLRIATGSGGGVLGAPANPDPPNGATLAFPPLQLRWGPVNGADSYDVYVDGTHRGRVLVPSWFSLEPWFAGGHRWRVVANAGAASMNGPDWTFVVRGSRLDGVVTISAGGPVETTRVYLRRFDRPSEPIDASVRTWVVVHGRNSSSDEENIELLASAVTESRSFVGSADQVLVLDWREGAGEGLVLGFQGQRWISRVGMWAAEALANYGFAGSNLNLIGHSWGSYVADELGERMPFVLPAGSGSRGVHSIVALDPAARSGEYNVGARHFSEHSVCSWAFHSATIAGSETAATTAVEAFVVNFGLLAGPVDAHTLISTLFANMIVETSGDAGRYFQLDRLLRCQPGPWRTNQYDSLGGLEPVFGSYEAKVRARERGARFESIDFQPLAYSSPISMPDDYATGHGVVLNVAAPGVLGNDLAGGTRITAALQATASNGVVALSPGGAFTYTPNAGFSGVDSFSYRASNGSGLGTLATVRMSVALPGGLVPPTNFRLLSMAGNALTLAWTPSTAGSTPSSIRLEGGRAPSEVLGTLPLSATVATTLSLPDGDWYLRARVFSGGLLSTPSNESLVHVNAGVSPSAPANLLGSAVGNQVNLAWMPTLYGGAPEGAVLHVSGAISLSLPLGQVDRFSYVGVPAGTYTFTVTQSNASGASGPSNPVTLSFPAQCSEAPETPVNFVAYQADGRVHLNWDPPTSGGAPTGYIINVTGAFAGSLATSERAVIAAAPAGRYSVTISSTGACGSSHPTAVQTIVVP